MVTTVMNEARLLWRLFTDQRVSTWTKMIPVAAFLYIVSPIDLVPDFIVGLGQLDDLTILLGGLRVFRSMVPEHIVQEHQEQLNGRVVEAPAYRVSKRD